MNKEFECTYLDTVRVQPYGKEFWLEHVICVNNDCTYFFEVGVKQEKSGALLEVDSNGVMSVKGNKKGHFRLGYKTNRWEFVGSYELKGYNIFTDHSDLLEAERDVVQKLIKRSFISCS